MQLQGQHVLILGLGASGLAMARWCAHAGADVTVADTRDMPPQLAALQAEWPAVRFVPGPFEASLVEGTSVRAVFRSPGLAPEVVALRSYPECTQCMHRWPRQLPKLGVPETRHGLRARSRHPMPNRCSRHPLSTRLGAPHGCVCLFRLPLRPRS